MAERSNSHSHSRNDQTDVIDEQRVNPWEIRKITAGDTAYSVGDTNDGQKERSTAAIDALQKHLTMGEQNRGEKLLTSMVAQSTRYTKGTYKPAIPKKFEIPISMKTGSLSRLTSIIWERAVLKLSGSTKQGQRSYSAENKTLPISKCQNHGIL